MENTSIYEKNEYRFELDNVLLKVHVYKDDEYCDCVDISCKMDNFYFMSFCREYLLKNK